MRRVAALVAVAALAVGVAACGSDATAVTFAATGAWSRPTPPGATDGVIYLTVSTDRADELVDVDVPATVAASAGLHATVIGGDGGHHHGGGDGGGDGDEPGTGDGAGDTVTMADVDTFPLAAGGTVVFEPGGNHVMLEGLARPLSLGDRYTATLHFASGRTLDVEVIVADNPPG